MVRFAAATGTADAIRAARGLHRWHFAKDEEKQLRTALPHIGWQRAGDGTWSLPYGDFVGLVLAASSREVDPAFDGAFQAGIPSDTLVDRSWLEVCKGMTASDWEPTEWPPIWGYTQ